MRSAPPGPAAIAAAKQRLAVARAALDDRPREQAVESLAALFDAWRDPGFPWRRRLEQELPAAAGFHPATVAAGLELALERWDGAALRETIHRELRVAGENTAHSGFELTSVLLAGSIPMPTMLALALPLALHSPVLAKPASRDPKTAALFAASLSDLDPTLARCVEVVPFPSDDAASRAAFLDAPCVVATGSDETIASVSSRIPTSTRLVAHGHRLSIAALGPEALAEARLPRLAERLALDVALWDQLGCLSPVAIFCETSRKTAAAAADALAEHLAAALEAAEARMPRGDVDAPVAAAIRRERDKAQMRRAAGRDVRVRAASDLAWTVVREADAEWRGAPLHRFVRIHPVPDREALLAAVAPLGRHLAGVALAGFGAEGDAVARRLGEFGASRICDPGMLQAPALGWHHDNQALLVPLMRLYDREDRHR